MSSGILRKGKFSSKAAAAASAQVGDALALNEPLLGVVSSNNNRSVTRVTDELSSDDDDDDDDDDEYSLASEELLPPSMTGTEIATTFGLSVLVAAGIAASASAMVAVPSAVVFFMGGICVVNAPSVAVKHLKIAKSEGIRPAIDDIRKAVELLTSEIDFLHQSVDDLQAEANVLVGLEQDLKTIATQQHSNVNDIVKLVNENEDILSKMNVSLRQTFVTAMAKTIMRSMKCGDRKINLKDLPYLSLRLHIQLEPYGIKLDTTKFEAMVKEDNDIFHVLKFCGNMLSEDDNSTANGTDDDNSSVDSELTFDFESFCRTLDDEGETIMTQEEKESMAVCSDRYSKGSVEVARGKRKTLVRKSLLRDHQKDVRRKSIMKEVKKRQTVLAAKCASSQQHQQRQRGGHTRRTRGGRPPMDRSTHLRFADGLIVTKG